MEKFWGNLLPHEPANVSWENKSIDVVIKGCFFYYDTTACVRNSLLAIMGFLSLLLCVIRITKLHVFHHPQIHQYLIFYAASFEIMFLMAKWLAINDLYQVEFAASYLKMLQFILLCHYHWSLVSRILHQQKLIGWIILPLLGGFFFFFSSIITALAMISHFSTWEECLAPHWLLLAFIEFLGIQLFVVSGFYITRNINTISATPSFKWEQKRYLWSVIVTYELSSVVTMVYYILLQAIGNEETGCSGIFGHAQNIYTPIYATFMVIKYLLPIWMMLGIYYPTRGCMTSEDERLLGWSVEGSTTSVFSPSTRFLDSYKQLILPVQNVFFVDRPILRRSLSSPAIVARPSLEPIQEDNSIAPHSRIQHIGYGAADSFRSQPDTAVFVPHRSRSRHDSGVPSRAARNNKGYRVTVSLNHCSDEIESVTPSSGERA